MAASKKLSAKEVVAEKSNKILDGVGYWASFYRKNPQRFCAEYLNIHLKLFQKILIYAMMVNNYIMYLAARGQGKTYLTALFCIVRCILFPGTKIVVCSSTRSQGNEVLLKITDDFCKLHGWGSDNLNREIAYKSVGANNAVIEFRNGSWIKVATANDNARGMRANILIIDEFRMVDLDVINTVLRKFLTSSREPEYLYFPEYKNLVERNKEIYMSSCWYQSHWSYEKLRSYFVNFLDDKKKYFVCGLPYQVSIYEGLLPREQVEDEMSENDFDPIKFMMEMGALFFGDSDGSFFKYDDLSKRRKIKSPFYHLGHYSDRNRIPDVAAHEKRILSVDVALMKSKKKENDASALFINSAIQNNDVSYTSNIVYGDTYEGLTTDALGIIVMRTFYHYKCTDLVIDTNGLGLGVADFIVKDQYDPETGDTYRAMTFINDPDMAIRCKVKNANKVLWSIKATAAFNNEICVSLRNGIQNGKINLLVSSFEADEILRDTIKGFNKLSPKDTAKYKMSYVQTDMAVNELINLDHEVVGGNIKIKERSGMRKDRYSSLAYNYWCVCQLERKLKPKNDNVENMVKRLPIKRGKSYSIIQ